MFSLFQRKVHTVHDEIHCPSIASCIGNMFVVGCEYVASLVPPIAFGPAVRRVHKNLMQENASHPLDKSKIGEKFSIGTRGLVWVGMHRRSGSVLAYPPWNRAWSFRLEWTCTQREGERERGRERERESQLATETAQETRASTLFSKVPEPILQYRWCGGCGGCAACWNDLNKNRTLKTLFNTTAKCWILISSILM
mmetsp:Transcript_8189/g.18997  ORF Transcript_8189/g.18997 Transcript_8189/m.18997 type:complete len:196 (-) Transcript_8189:1371-1958(-)